MKRYNSLLGIISLLTAVLVLTACGGGTPSNTNNPSSSGGDPSVGAKAFFDALYSGGAVDNLVCTTDTTTAAALKSSMESMRDTLTASGATIDTSGLTYAVSNQTADTADVSVSGNLKLTAAGTTTDSPFPAATIKMRNEGGTWKVCG
ncbi:MAG: hypothetical protein KF726_04130 [Anaerolineae bacterium]|nr:hypothetical protein [Anaerolineae bacterium]